ILILILILIRSRISRGGTRLGLGLRLRLRLRCATGASLVSLKGWNNKAQGIALVVLHKSAGFRFRFRAKTVPGPSEVVHPLQANPNGLSAGFTLRSLDIASQTADQVNHFG